MSPQVNEIESVGKAGCQNPGGGLREENLPSLRQSTDAGGAIRSRPEATATALGLARVHPHPDTNPNVVRPRLSRHPTHEVGRRAGGLGGTGED